MRVHLVSIPVQDPIEAHDVYVNKLGFESKEFDAAAKLAIVVPPGEETGPQLLLEPCIGTFAEEYQRSAFQANLPILILSAPDLDAELERLRVAGVRLRPDLDRPDWGLMNLFEDGCGNLLMLQKTV